MTSKSIVTLLPSLPALPEESWRRTDPAAFFLPESDMLDFSGKPVVEALAQGARPWKIAFEDTGSAESVSTVRTLLSAHLSPASLDALFALESSRTAFLFLDDGFARVVSPARGTSQTGVGGIEISGVSVDLSAVVGRSAIGAALSARLRAAVPQTLTVKVTAPRGLSESAFTLVVVAAGASAFSQSFHHVRYVVESGARADILHIDAGSHFAHHRHDIFVSSGAQVNEAWFHAGTERHVDASLLLERRVEVGEGGLFRDALVFAPTGAVRVVSNVVLCGEKAQAHCSTAVVASSGVLDYEPVHEHAGPGAKSDLRAKMVASGRGRAVFQGLVLVHKEAPRSEAVQINKNLLLSKRARIDSLPRLEILPNEVSCKHGSATGEVDAKQLYYLGTRGFSEEQAKALVIRGFAMEGVDALPREGVLAQLAEDTVDALVSGVVKI
jgi:hypothetical protein